MIKRFSSLAVRSMAFARFVTLLEKFDHERSNVLHVLTYHRVDELGAHPELYPGLISARPPDFSEQMAYLARCCRVVSIDEALAAADGGPELPPRSVLVTFDDAYVDFAQHAWPILKRHSLPVTLFVPTAFPDNPEMTFWWDRLHEALHNATVEAVETPLGRLSLASSARRSSTCRRLRQHIKTLPHAEAMALVDEVAGQVGAKKPINRVLSWDALRQLAGEGVALGAHTRTHPLLDRIDADEIRAELIGSLADLRREIGQSRPIFAYPSGHVGDRAPEILREEGIRLAFTTQRGVNDLARCEPLRLHRINVGRQTNVALLRAQLVSW